MATKKGAQKTVENTEESVKKASARKPAAEKAAGGKVAPANEAEPVKASAKKTVASSAGKVEKESEASHPDADQPVKPVKKPAVEADSQQEVKPAIKPLEGPAKKEAPARGGAARGSAARSVKYEPEYTKSVLDTSSNKQEQFSPTMRYSDAELAEFRELITKKLDTAKKELAYLQGLITRKDESGDLDEGRYMTMEDGSMSMEREQLSQMASRQIQFIDHLEKAMMRIENKTYGICRVTGKLIDKARLRAVPHATLSIEAKQMMNK